jgi:hypothetical protein
MRFVILCAVFLFIVSPVFADMIYFKDGSAVSGKVLRVTDTDVEYSTSDVPFDKQSRSNLTKIIYANGKTVVFDESATIQPRNPQNVTVSQPTTNTAPPAEQKVKGAEQHDGFYLGFLLGYGYGKSSLSGNNSLELRGVSDAVCFDIGYAVMNDFILYFAFGGYLNFGENITFGGTSYKYPDKKQTAYNFGSGIGFRKYFMPENIFISASIIRSKVNYTGDFVKGDSDYGYTFGGAIGKEWWVSDNWGLGIALFGEYGKTSSKDQFNNKNKITEYYLGLAFTATYN